MAQIAVIVANFYKDLADTMVNSANAVLTEYGHEADIIEIPGVFELPAALSMAQASGRYDGYLALGCVIRGETTHYDVVCDTASEGISRFASQYREAVGFGVITAENRKQATERANASGKDFGGKAARACIRMLELKQEWMTQ